MNGSHLVRYATTAAVLAALAFFGCSQKSSETSSTSENAQPVDSTTVSAAAPNTGESGLKAYVDPVTGQLREPTPEDIAAEKAAEAARKKTLGVQTEPREVKLPNGAVTIELGDSAQQPLVGCVEKNGDVKMDHDCEKPSSKSGAKK